MEFFRWTFVLFALAVVGDVAGQSQACLRDRPWPASYSARVERTGAGWIAEITLTPSLNAYALGNAYLEQGRIVIDVAIIDDCGGFGPHPPQAVTFRTEALPAAIYPVDVRVTEQHFGPFLETHPTVYLSALAVGQAEPIPAFSIFSLAFLGLAVMISVMRSIGNSHSPSL